MKAANAKHRDGRRQRAGADAAYDDSGINSRAAVAMPGKRTALAPRARVAAENVRSMAQDVTTAPHGQLSTRAGNVLKELAIELLGESPPKGSWVPSRHLLKKLTFTDLAAARNCGPQTTDEIVQWARSQGVVIRPPRHAGKSLSAMWRDVVARSSTGEFGVAEMTEALERSLRRGNTRIPVEVQDVLLKLLNTSCK